MKSTEFSEMHIRSATLEKILLELGFPADGVSYGRNPKPFTAEVKAFRRRFAAEGNPLPFNEAFSREAYRFAVAFCKENDRGSRLWPSSKHWRTWADEKQNILRLLSHLFSIQAWNESRSIQRKRLMGTLDENDEAGMSCTGVFDPDSLEIHEACAIEIQALAPYQTKGPIKGLGKWFEQPLGVRPYERWPTDVDNRIRLFMHERNYYSPGENLRPVDELQERLQQGTEFQHLPAFPRDSHLSVRNIVHRIKHLAKDLEMQGLLIGVGFHKKSRPRKSACFVEYWRRRHSSWKSSSKAADSAPRESENRIAGSAACSIPGSASPSKVTSVSRSESPESDTTPPNSPSVYEESEVDDESEDLYGATPEPINRQKRRRLNPDISTQHSSAVGEEYEMASQGHNLIDAVTNDDAAAHQDGDLQNPAALSRRSTQSESLYTNSQISGAEDSSAHEISQFQLEQGAGSGRAIYSADPRGKAGQSEENTSAVSTRIDNTSALDGQGTPLTTTTIENGAPKKPPLLLIFQKSARNLDLDTDNPLPHSNLKSDVLHFFQLYSQHAGIPVETIDCLTFTAMFDSGNKTVIRQGDEAAWKKMVKKIRLLYLLVRDNLSSEEECEIVVQVGDQKTWAVPVDDDEW